MELVEGRSLKPLKQPLDPQVCQKAARYAVRVFEEMSKRSELLKGSSSSSTPTTSTGHVAVIDREDVLPYLGELLGKGGFNCVYELRSNHLRDVLSGNEVIVPTFQGRTDSPPTSPSPEDDPAQDTPHNNEDNDYDDDASIKINHKKLAVKFLSDEAMFDPQEFCNGAADLYMEAKYLTALAAHPHPALIRLHGVCSAGPDGFSKVERAGFFLVIDRLYDTLDRRMDVWKEIAHRRHGQTDALQALFLQRLLVAQDIASAIRHLHKLNIVFRDLKPDNVGFDYDGQVKLFDFGLAKELDPKQRLNDGLYKMSGGTGSRRFMAPEVALAEPYNLSADLYSYAILLWEVLTLRKAFTYMTLEDHREQVVLNGERPELTDSTTMIWSDGLTHLMETCWHPDPFERPTARDVCRILRTEIQNIYYESFGDEKNDEKQS